MKKLTPKHVLAQIQKNKDKEIYFTLSTEEMMRESRDCKGLERFRFLIGYTDVEFEYGKTEYLGRVEFLDVHYADSEEYWESLYERPDEADEILIL